MFFNLVGILKSGYLCNVILKTIFLPEKKTNTY